MPPTSQSSRHQSRLSREMNRDFNRTMGSVASSTGSNHGTVSADSTISTDFNPDKDEAIMSTCQLDNNFSQRLPQLRDTAKKYGRWAPRPQQDFVINTSAIGRAFPDFSQGGSSDDSLSFEIGRGAKARQRATSGRRPRAEFSGDMDSPVVTLGDLKILSTPKGPNKKVSVLQEVLRQSTRNETPPKRANSEQKENVPPSSQKSSKASPYVSHASRTTSGERRTLAELHARVADDSDGSFIGDERPPTVTFQTTNTRFSNAQSRVPHTATVSSRRQQYADAVADAIRNASDTPSKAQTKTEPQVNQNINPTTPNPTQQSFLLPNNMPEVSENISGTLLNGMPFTRNGRVHSPSSAKRNGAYGQVDGIPLPDEEEDIYKSLEIFKARVAILERENIELQRSMINLQNENDQLKLENRSDSALGDISIQNLIAENTGMFCLPMHTGNLLTEIPEIRAQAADLQTRLDATDRKMSTSELNLKMSVAERDAAVLQLSKAIEDNEQAEADNDMLRREIQALRNQLAESMVGATENDLLRRDNEALKDQLADFVVDIDVLTRENGALRAQLAEFVSEGEEVSLDWQKRESALRKKISRQDEAVKDMQDMTNEMKGIFETTREINVVTSTRAKDSTTRRASKDKRSSASRVLEEQDVASKVMEKAQNHMDQIKAARAENVSSLGRDHHHTRKTPEVKATDSVRARSRSQSRQSENFQLQHHGVHETAPNRELLVKTARSNPLQDNTTRKKQHLENTSQSHRLQANTTRSKVHLENTARSHKLRDNTTRGNQHPDNAIGRRQLRDNTSRSNQLQDNTARSNQLEDNTSRANQVQDNTANDASDEGSSCEDSTIHKEIGNTTNDADRTIDGSDYASIVGDGFMANLRQMLKEARAMKAEKLAASEVPAQDDTIHTIQSTRSSHAPSVKGLAGILKNAETQNNDELTGHFSVKSVRSVKSVDRLDEDHTTRSNKSHRRRHSDGSIHTRINSGRPRSEVDDMTSAYIIPDISINAQSSPVEHPVLSASARRVLDGLCQHESKNCTVCTRVASFDQKTGTKNATKQTIRIEKPIPVSLRMPIAAPYEDEPTIRPSVEPGLALATVIKSLDDEIAHLKMKHAEVQAVYNKHDASLGMRQRKSLKKQIDQLLEAIEVKSDQVYGLYDVLEGQKEGEDDSELSLPWEGIDETV